MPKGVDIEWPSNADLLAMVREINRRGGDPRSELTKRFGCSPITLNKRLHAARLEAQEAARAVATEPPPGELMQQAEEEANRLTKAGASPSEPPQAESGTSGQSALETGLKSLQVDSTAADLRTFRQMLLIAQPNYGSLPSIYRETEHVTRAPEKVGDQWAQPTRRSGFLTWRMWTCVAVLDDGICLMVPVGSRFGDAFAGLSAGQRPA